MYTWQGCTVELAADPLKPEQVLSEVVELAYVQLYLNLIHEILPCLLKLQVECRYESDETPMTEYLNVHHTLNNCRAARRDGASSTEPRTLVTCKERILTGSFQ